MLCFELTIYNFRCFPFLFSYLTQAHIIKLDLIINFMKPKNRLQYVQEFRKITALEKLPTLKQGFGDLFLQNKQENAKFLRTREQPNIPQIQLNLFNQKFLQNQFIDQYRNDFHKNFQQHLQKKQLQISKETKQYNEWSTNLVTYPKQNIYTYKFYFGKASPPVPVCQISTGAKASNFQISSQKDQSLSKEIQEIKISNNKHYDFYEINKHMMFASKKDDFDQSQSRTDLVKVQLQKFKNYKTLQQIDKIDELSINYDHFSYEIDPNQMINESKTEFFMRYNILKENPISIEMRDNFKYISVLKSNENFNIQFFRDLGMPSREISTYVIKGLRDNSNNHHQLRKDQQENLMIQDKIDTHFLYFLTPAQLKIQAKKLSFYDIANITMGRVTNLNSHMCIRSEKVTRGQYEKLLKKVQRLYKMQTEGNNAIADKAIITDNIQENLQNKKDIFQKPNQIMSTQKIVDQILAIREQMHTFQPRDNHKLVSKNTLNLQIHNKLYKLLQKLYQMLLKDMPIKYPINQAHLHIDQFKGNIQENFDKKRLLWFVLSVLEQIQKGRTFEKDLRYLLSCTKKTQSTLVKYKGSKIVDADSMGAKSLYLMSKVPRANKSPSPINMNQKSITPNKTKTKQESTNYFKTPLKDKPQMNKLNSNSNVSKSPNRSLSPVNNKTVVKNSKNIPSFGQKSTTPVKNSQKLTQIAQKTPTKNKTPLNKRGMFSNSFKKQPSFTVKKY